MGQWSKSVSLGSVQTASGLPFSDGSTSNFIWLFMMMFVCQYVAIVRLV